MESPAEEIERAASLKNFPSKERRNQILNELQKLTKEVADIDRTYKAGYFLSWIAPEGGGRSWDEEVDQALTKRSEGHVPAMSYPAIERGFLDPKDPEGSKLDIKGGLTALGQLSNETNERFPEVAELAKKIIKGKRREFLFLRAVKNANHEEQIKYMPYSLPDSDLITFAKACYEARLSEKPMEKSEKFRLVSNVLNSGEIKEYFEYALRIANAVGWRVTLSDTATTINVSLENKAVEIPRTRRLNVVKFLGLIAHEIGSHVGTAVNAEQNGLGSIALGEDSEILQEGLAKIAERDVQKMLTGKEEAPDPYYVLAMDRSHKSDGSFWSVFNYIRQLRARELTKKGKGPKEVETGALKTAKRVTRRVFRGSTDLNLKGYTFTKDKAYLEGERLCSQLKERGLLGYLLHGKYDIATAIYLLQNGVIPKSAVNLVIDVSQKIWANDADRDFLLNLENYRETINEPYWREVGLSDEEYLRRWKDL